MEEKLEGQLGERVDIKKVLSQNIPAINATLEKWIPRKVTEELIIEIAGKQSYSCDVESLNKILFEPIWELLDRGGKRWRSTLLLLIAESLGKQVEEVMDFVLLTEIIHNGSLIIDDIEDNSHFRRGKPCLHKIIGVDAAINAGNFMYFLPLRVLRELKDHVPEDVILRCYEIYSHDMMNLHLGQGLDICWHSKLNRQEEPTVPNYLQMCANKTGGLARMSAKLSAVVCGASEAQIEAFGKFAESIGVAFQIQDDILNLEENSSLSDGKGGAGEDIHEGKRTIMVIHSFESAPPAQVQRLKDILDMKTNDPDLIREAIQIIKENKSIEFAKQKAEELIVSAWKEIDCLLPSSTAKAKLKALVNFLVQRDV